MLGQPKGYVIVDKELKFTRKPPKVDYLDYDIAEDYFKALKLKMVPVIDVAVSGDAYLVLGQGEKSGTFIWEVDKRDTISKLIPYDVLHPEAASLDKLIELSKRIASGKATDEDAEKLFSFMAMWKATQ